MIKKRRLHDWSEPQGFPEMQTCDAAWIHGDLLQFSLCEAMYKRKGLHAVLDIFREYHDELLRMYDVGQKDGEGYPLVNPSAIDFVPCNVIKNSQGMFGIDHEWRSQRTFGVDYVLFRAVYLFAFDQYPFILRNLSIPDDNIVTFITSILQAIYPQYDRKRHEQNKQMEEQFQSTVTGRPVKMPSAEEFKILKDPLLRKDAQINALLNSWSWKVTKPLRWFRGKKESFEKLLR